MDISIKNQIGLDATLHIQVASADYQEELNKKLADSRKKMTIPGFRQGKAPLGLVKKLAEKDLKHDIINHLLQHKIQDFFANSEHKLALTPISAYEAEDIDWSNDTLEFTYNIGLRPAIKLDFEALNKLSRKKISVDEATAEEEIKKLRKQTGRVEELAEVADDESTIVYVRFKELDEEGNVLEGGVEKTKMLPLKELPASVKELLLGKAKDFTTQVDIHKLMSNEQIMDIFELDANATNDLNDKFELMLVNLFKMNEAELNQEFFDKYFEQGSVTTSEEFKQEWAKLMASFYNQDAESEFVSEMKKALLENTEITYPEETLKKYILMAMKAKDASEVKDFDAQLEQFRKDLKWEFIADYIQEEQNISISEDEILDYTLQMLKAELRKSGYGEIDDNTLSQYGMNYLSSENNYTRTKLALRDGKIFEYLLTQVHPQEEEMDSKKFLELKK